MMDYKNSQSLKTEKQMALAAEAFAARWEGRGYEKGDTQLFWTELLTEVFGVENPSTFIRYEEQVKVDKTYSINIVYNNFPWPAPTEEQRSRIERTAQGILDARALYPDSSLADLYDELTMPAELQRAHQDNDRAVMQAYGFPVKSDFTESQCVAALFRMYEDLTRHEV